MQIDGFTVATAMDRQTLKGVAAVTNGSYHQADDQAGVEGHLQDDQPAFRDRDQYTEITALFAAAAAMLLVAGALISVLWFGRVV